MAIRWWQCSPVYLLVTCNIFVALLFINSSLVFHCLSKSIFGSGFYYDWWPCMSQHIRTETTDCSPEMKGTAVILFCKLCHVMTPVFLTTFLLWLSALCVPAETFIFELSCRCTKGEYKRVSKAYVAAQFFVIHTLMSSSHFTLLYVWHGDFTFEIARFQSLLSNVWMSHFICEKAHNR